MVVLFTSCQEQKQRYFSDSSEIETLKAGIKAYESGDWDTWRSHFADTAKIYVNSKEPMSLSERSENLSQMTTMMSSYGFDHSDDYIEMVLDKDDETWVYYWATHNGTFAANGKSLDLQVHLAVQFKDGKIVAEHVYYDATQMNKIVEEITQSEMASSDDELSQSDESN
ncbi:nuclear transport factor 2 family protein [Winogradskyella sp. A3E31]|uniref:nuclear transport factor 2 family protein n=1 Tax=Winogradskyella sp. A3E31 TaxID=3349637 RepID=UPI00398BA37A